MFKYFSYDNEKINIKKCARLHKRSLSIGKIVVKEGERGLRLERKFGGMGFDEVSIKDMGGGITSIM